MVPRFSLLLMLLSWLYAHCSARCSSRGASDYAVEAFIQSEQQVDGSQVILTCRTTYGQPLLPHQRLQWTEGGVVVHTSLVHSVNLSTVQLVLQNLSRVHYGNYTCQCMNGPDNITFMLRTALREYTPHCSQPRSVLVTSHAMVVVKSRLQEVGVEEELVCSAVPANATVRWLRVINSTEEEWNGSVTLTQPSDQAKFLCLVDEAVAEVVYVRIAGYWPPILLLPPHDGAVVQHKGDFGFFLSIAACAAYSSEVQLKIDGGLCAECSGENNENGVDIAVVRGPKSQLSAAMLMCVLNSTGEVTEVSYMIQFVTRGSWVCVNAGDSAVRTEGENFTVSCTTFASATGVTIRILHTLHNGTTESITNITSETTSGFGLRYKYFIARVSSRDAGEYRCVAAQKTDREEDILYLTVLTSDTPIPEPSFQSQLGGVATSQSLQTSSDIQPLITTTPPAPSTQPTSSSTFPSFFSSLPLPETSSSVSNPQTTFSPLSSLPPQTGVDPGATMMPSLSPSSSLSGAGTVGLPVILLMVSVPVVVLLLQCW